MTISFQLRSAARTLRLGGLVAYPTEAVWGFGCDPQNSAAVTRLLALKRRDWRKGLILIGASFDQLEPYIQRPSNSAMKRAAASWPGPNTWVFPASDYTPPWVSGDHDSIAIRVTAHPVAAALCRAFGAPIISTSANRSTQPPALSATTVRLRFPKAIDFLVPGVTGGLDRPTPIRHVVSGLILRR